MLTPAESAFLSQIGYTLYKEGQFQKALSIFEGLVELDPRSAEFRLILAVLYHLTDDHQAALKEGLKALQLKPNDVPLMATIGEIYLSLNQPARAREILSQAYTRARESHHPALGRISLLLQHSRY